MRNDLQAESSVWLLKSPLGGDRAYRGGCTTGHSVCYIIGCIWTVFTDAAEVSKCYRVNNEQYCFYSGGTVSSWDAAREFCGSKNSTLPIIRDENTDRVFQQFLVDSYDVIQNRFVWLNIYAHPVSDSVTWHWVNGSESGQY